MPTACARHARALTFAAALCTAVLPATAAEALEGPRMECVMATEIQADRQSEALGSPLRIALDEEARRVRLETPPLAETGEAEGRLDLLWLDRERLRAVVAVVVEAPDPEQAPVRILDLDFANPALRYGSFGRDRTFEALPEPIDYDCRRLN